MGEFLAGVLGLYNDRASSRVADVSSVLTRDAAIWIVAFSLLGAPQLSEFSTSKLDILKESLGSISENPFILDSAKLIDALVGAPEWGRL